jgi:hypothetical protein
MLLSCVAINASTHARLDCEKRQRMLGRSNAEPSATLSMLHFITEGCYCDVAGSIAFTANIRFAPQRSSNDRTPMAQVDPLLSFPISAVRAENTRNRA